MIYSGNRILNSNNIFFVGSLILYGYFQFTDPDSKSTFPLGLVAVTMLMVMMFQAFYFETTSDELVVRNYTLPFLIFRYYLNDITGVQLNDTGYRSTAIGLKILRSGKSSSSFRNVSLRVNDWQNLVDDLRVKKISIEINAVILKNQLGISED